MHVPLNYSVEPFHDPVKSDPPVYGPPGLSPLPFKFAVVLSDFNRAATQKTAYWLAERDGFRESCDHYWFAAERYLAATGGLWRMI